MSARFSCASNCTVASSLLPDREPRGLSCVFLLLSVPLSPLSTVANEVLQFLRFPVLQIIGVWPHKASSRPRNLLNPHSPITVVLQPSMLSVFSLWKFDLSPTLQPDRLQQVTPKNRRPPSTYGIVIKSFKIGCNLEPCRSADKCYHGNT